MENKYFKNVKVKTEGKNPEKLITAWSNDLRTKWLTKLLFLDD